MFVPHPVNKVIAKRRYKFRSVMSYYTGKMPVSIDNISLTFLKSTYPDIKQWPCYTANLDDDDFIFVFYSFSDKEKDTLFCLTI